MALILRWQASEIRLCQTHIPLPYDPATPGSADEGLLARQELDFDLSPLTLTSEGDRARFINTLALLGQKADASAAGVYIKIPSIWGISLHLPNPDLAGEELADQVYWELSKALLEPVDHYQYRFSLAPDHSIRLAALRKKLLEAIGEIAAGAGFKALGIYLDDDDFAGVNLIGPDLQSEISSPIPKMESPPEPSPRQVKRFKDLSDISAEPKRRRGGLWAAIVIGSVILVTALVWMQSGQKPRRPDISQQIAKPEPELSAPAETSRTDVQTAILAAAADTLTQDTARSASPVVQEPSPGELAQTVKHAVAPLAIMPQRLAILAAMLNSAVSCPNLELLSFTGDRFMVQFSSGGTDLQSVRDNLQALESVKDLKWKEGAAGVHSAALSLSGKISTNPTVSAVRPNSGQIRALADKNGLLHPAAGDQIFTGSLAGMTVFLSQMAEQNFAIYRLLIMPWAQNQYRVVVEI